MKKLGVLLLTAALLFGGMKLAVADSVGIGNGNELAYFGIPQLTTLAAGSLNPTTDYFPVYQASSKTVKKVLVNGNKSPVGLSASASLTEAAHSGHVLYLTGSGAQAYTLPAATGTGDIYKFVIGAVNTSGYSVSHAGSDLITGSIHFASAVTGRDYGTATGAAITINGTTKGGTQVGDWFELQDVNTGVWATKGSVTPTGMYATPFS